MTLVTVIRRVPPPIVGTVGVIQDRAFETFEERLDWLEAMGLLVERFDPDTARSQVAAHESVRQLLEKEGDRCLPLILVDEDIVSRGAYPTRAHLARLVGQAQAEHPRRLGAVEGDFAELVADRH
jgi:hypothetical protein